ncbi:hypothetical protein JCM8097_005606 [Rhodosporidiobolus ruineniae]
MVVRSAAPLSSLATDPGPAAYNTGISNIASQQYSTGVLGPCVLGWSLQIALWGATLAWAASYVRSDLFKRDPLRRKLLLLAAVGLCTTQAVLNFCLLFYWTTTQQRAAEDLVRPTVLDALQPLSVAFLGPMVQAFLAKRAIRLLVARWAKWTATILFSVVIALEFIAAVFNVIISLFFHEGKLQGVLLRLATFNLASGIWLWFAAIADVGVTALLIVVLRKRIAGFNPKTDGILRALSWLAIQSASYTAFFAVAGAIAAYSAPQSYLASSAPYPLWYVLAGLYPIALLTTLSSRSVFAKSSSNCAASHHCLGGREPAPRTIHLPQSTTSGHGQDSFSKAEKRTSWLVGRGSQRDRDICTARGGLGGFITVEKDVHVHVDDDEGGVCGDRGCAEEEKGVQLLSMPVAAARRKGRGRGDERDLEAGIGEDSQVVTITGKSDRREVWE